MENWSNASSIGRRSILKTIGATGALAGIGGAQASTLSDTQRAQQSTEGTTHDLLVRGVGDPARYQFTTSGTVSGTGSLESNDSVDGNRGSGRVAWGDDRFRFTGEILSFELLEGSADDVNVFVDGQKVSLTELNASGASARTLTVDEPWQTYQLAGQYESPVVIASPLSYAGSNPCHVRLQNVSSESFDARIEEWDYLNDIHYDETVGSLAIESGTHGLDNGSTVEVGRTLADHTWSSVSFDQTFDQTPLVFCQSETMQGNQAIVTRVSNVSSEGFDVKVQEEEANGSHKVESLGYVAIEPGVGTLHGMAFEAGRTTIDGHWHSLSFENGFTNPVFLAGMQTYNGSNPAGLRHRNLSETSVTVKVDEERSLDDEMYHIEEQIAYLVLESNETPLYVGETIPEMPHAPHGATLPTGTNFHPSDATPVLRASDVTDYGAVDYVADPFMFVEEGTWHMFFEIVNENRRPDAPIGHATSSDGLHWTYNQVVLTKRYHTSFPLVWKYQNEYYMCPPTGKKVELYKAQQFPTDWTHIGNAIDVDYYPHDPTFVRYKGRWWLFTERGNENVMVYHSTDLEREGWIPHEGNPVVTDRLQAGRQGGRPIVVDDRLFLYFQDSVENYGDAVRCYEVTDLSPSTYADQEVSGSPVLHEFGSDWANDGMHTFDPWWLGPGKGWRCAVDGVRAQESSEDLWTIGIVDIPPTG
ncbi:glucosamine inositolphosphorylceramide transferase family protein [Halocatena marina]|uniref:glucosamine inositolphosphorylceramide transferase family protein n=1 Tax=Halocatena marina TaxID=2934937 RepID=UPI0020109962|nr:H-type lectin domain-containing protein [Halocatena marina]